MKIQANNSSSVWEKFEFGISYPATVAIIIPNVAGNILCCLVISKTKTLHNFCNFLLVNLAVSDMTAGMIELVVYTIYEYLEESKDISKETALRKARMLVHPVIQVSILTVTVISIERFLAITRPFQVMKRGRTRNLKYIIPGVWSLGFILNLPTFVAFFFKSWKDPSELAGTKELAVEGNVFLVSAYLLPDLLLSLTFLRILYFLRQRGRQFPSQQNQRNHTRANQRVAKLLGAVILSHNVCFLPYTIFGYLFTQSIITDVKKPSNVTAYNATYALQFLSPCLNPFIYLAHSKAFRDACKAILCRSGKIKP